MKFSPAGFARIFVGFGTAVALSACSAIEMPGSARYFSNRPGGSPFFRVASGLGGPTLAVQKEDGKWSKPRPMEPIAPTSPPLSTTPGLAAIVESAHRINEEKYIFIEFRADAKLHGHPLPSRYFLLPGGFAYPVPSTRQ